MWEIHGSKKIPSSNSRCEGDLILYHKGAALSSVFEKIFLKNF